MSATARTHTHFCYCVCDFLFVHSFTPDWRSKGREKEEQKRKCWWFCSFEICASSIVTTVLVKQRRFYYSRNWVVLLRVWELKCCIFDCTEDENTINDLQTEWQADTNRFWTLSKCNSKHSQIGRVSVCIANSSFGQQGFCWAHK